MLAQPPSSEAILRKADEVVARPDYQLDTPVNTSALWWLKILEWILTSFRWLFNALEGLPDALRWIITVGLAILLVVLLAHIVWTFVRAVRGAPEERRRRLREREAPANPEDLEREADTLAGQGDFIGSIRLLFRAALIRLQASEKRMFRPGFTNRELLRRYRTSPLLEPLTRFVETIDAKWYGEEPCSERDYVLRREDHAQLRTLIEGAGHAVSA